MNHISMRQRRIEIFLYPNSEADVWVTPDQLGEVYTDLRIAFRDVSLQDLDLWDNIAGPTDDERYPVRRNVLLLSGSNGRGLVKHYWGDVPGTVF